MKQKILSMLALMFFVSMNSWAQLHLPITPGGNVSVSLDKTSLTLTVGESETVTASITGGVGVMYSSWSVTGEADCISLMEEGNVATVTAQKAGTATITFRYSDKTVTCTVTVAAPIVTYNLTLAEGTEDADNWTISPNPAEEGQAITITYSGTKKVKSVKAVKKAAAPAGPTAYTLAESTVGMIVGTDGKAYAAADKDNLPSGVTAVAMVAYKSATAGSSLAIALADEGSMNWATAKSTCEGKTAIGDYSWKLPSKTEWKQMLSANGGNEGSYTGLNTALATAGGDSSKLQEKKYYWSSSVFSGDNPDEVFFINGGVEWSWNSPGTSDLVRAVLAF